MNEDKPITMTSTERHMRRRMTLIGIGIAVILIVILLAFAGIFHFSFIMWNGVHLVEGVVGSLLALWVVNS